MQYFYKKGIDITNDKQMFEFLKNHYTYYTMNSWNGNRSIANNVKMYNLGLSGDWGVALDFLSKDDYFIVNLMIEDWEADHPGYKLGFNGRSGGYLVLYNSSNSRSILPDEIDNCDNYEEYKRYCREYYGSVKANRPELVAAVKLVQDFDKFCDELRDFVDSLSTKDFAKEAMEEAVASFNEDYYDDLCALSMGGLVCDAEGIVNVKEISTITCLLEAFLRIADHSRFGYSLKSIEDGYLKLV